MTRNEIYLLVGIITLGVLIFLFGTIGSNISNNNKRYSYYDETKDIVYTKSIKKLATFTNRKPVLNIKDENISQINDDISEMYSDANRNNTYFNYKNTIKDEIISLVIITGDNTYLGNTYKVYNVGKFDDGKYYMISNKTLSSPSFFNISINEYENAIIARLKQHYEEYKNRVLFLKREPMSYSAFMEMALTEPITFDSIQLYLCKESRMCIYYEPTFSFGVDDYLSVRIDYNNYQL